MVLDSALQFGVALAFSQTTQRTTRNLRVQWSRPLVLALVIPLGWGVEFHGPVHGPTLIILATFGQFQIEKVQCKQFWITVKHT